MEAPPIMAIPIRKYGTSHVKRMQTSMKASVGKEKKQLFRQTFKGKWAGSHIDQTIGKK